MLSVKLVQIVIDKKEKLTLEVYHGKQDSGHDARISFP
jgi:hypothetical protein